MEIPSIMSAARTESIVFHPVMIAKLLGLLRHKRRTIPILRVCGEEGQYYVGERARCGM